MSGDLQPERAPLVATLSLLLALVLGGILIEAGVGHCAEPDSVGLRAGQPAPYAGLLLPPGAARDLLRTLDDLDAERAQRALDAEQHKADIAAVEARLAAVEAARRACEADRASPPKLPHRAWYEAPGIVLIGGFVLGVGLAVAVVEVAR